MALTLAQLIRQQRDAIEQANLQRQQHTDVLTRLRDAATAARRDLTPAEADQATAARDARQRIDSTIRAHQERLDVFEAEERDQLEIERLSNVTASPAGASRGLSSATTTEHRVGGASTSARPSGDASGQLVRKIDGRPAAVERGQRFGDHPIVAEYAARRSQSERPVIDTHGGLGNLVRSMTTSSGSALVPTVWASDVIDLARNAAAVLQAGAQIVPMDAKVLQVGRLTTDPTAAFRAEGSTITASDPVFDNVTLTAKTLSCQVTGSLEFFQDSLDADQVVEQAIGRKMGLELDKQALFGGLTAGAEVGATGFNATYPNPPNPTGILQALTTLGYGVLGNGANGTAQTPATPWTEIIQTVLQPTMYNETPNALIWPARMAQRYADLYDTLYQPLRRPQALDNVQTFVSNQIPINMTQGTSTTNQTDVFAGDFTKLLIGQRLDMQIQVLTERYAEAGQISIIATWRGDVGLARPRAFSVWRYLKNT